MATADRASHYDVFVSSSFEDNVDDSTGEVDPAYQEYIGRVLRRIRDLGLTAFCALEHEEWHSKGNSTRLKPNGILDIIDISDKMLIPINDDDTTVNTGEVYYALGRGIPVYMLLEHGVNRSSFWNDMLVVKGRVKPISDISRIKYKNHLTQLAADYFGVQPEE